MGLKELLDRPPQTRSPVTEEDVGENNAEMSTQKRYNLSLKEGLMVALKKRFKLSLKERHEKSLK